MGKVEQAILGLLEGNVEIYQSDLVRQSGFSRSRVSEVLASLETSGLISRVPLGKNFRVILNRSAGSSKSFAKKNPRKKKILSLGMIRASEYPFIISFENLLREKMGITLNCVIYDNGLRISRDLAQFRLDLGIAPVLTHFVFYSTGSPIKMIAPAGSGGASILVNNRRKHSKENFTIATTKLSTMELMLRSSMNDGDISRDSAVQYYSSPRMMMNSILSGKVDAACIWEPYSTKLLKKRCCKKIVRYAEEEHVCCALAAGNHLESDLQYRIAKTLTESIEVYRRNPENYISSYSRFMRFDEKIMKVSSKEYAYPLELDHQKLARQFEQAGVKIPIPSSVKDAVLPAN